MLARPGPTGVEIYFQQRPGMAAFPDLHVFPGGKLDEEDVQFARERCDLPLQQSASRQLGLDTDGLAYWVAVVRECFEEAGVLLAYDAKQRLVSFPAADAKPLREAMIERRLSLAELCDRFQLTLALDHLHYFSHWITPEVAPKRFNTRFFLAVMPDRQETLRHATETRTGEWVTPVEALAKAERGDWQMIAPTIYSLTGIKDCPDIDALVEHVGKGGHLSVYNEEVNEQGMQPWAS